ncbi:MAG: hypothetical protein PHE83_10965 [Opitutaceae bacterium]|nr:hypothetical protein [Opitutaceae bacterium]
MRLPAELSLALFEAAAISARAAARLVLPEHPRQRVGQTLRPGPATPLWNGLVKQARPHLRKRGEKVKLARILGLPRQRIQDCLKAGVTCLDAERTLLLLCWVARRQQGRELTT